MTYSSEVLADSPLLYWRLGESSGTTAVDASGNSRNGTYNGGPTLGVTGLLTGDSNTAVTFDGVNDYVTGAAPATTSAFTIEFWFKGSASGGQLLMTRYPSTSGQRLFYVGVGSGGAAGKVEFAVKNNAGVEASVFGATLIGAGARHIVCTYDGSASRIYLNGSLDGTSTTVTGALASVSPALEVAARTASPTFMAGTFDEVALYNTALSGARISAHYSAGTAPAADQIVIAGTMPAVAGAFNLATSKIARVAGAMPAMVGGLNLDGEPVVRLSANMPPMAGAVALDNAAVGSLRANANMPTISGGLLLERSIESEVNRAGAWERDNIGTAVWSPPVTEPTAAILPANIVAAQAYTAPTIVGTDAILDATYARETAHRERIIIAGRDMSFWRGIPTPAAEYQLVQPFLWGAASIDLPQVVLPFEQPGHGDLWWLRRNANVLIQDVDPETNEVIATRYRGIIVAFDTSGPLRIECGGRLTGKASLQDRQMRLIQSRRDAGGLVASALRNLRGVVHQPVLGTTTGIKLIDWGGGGLLDYLNELVGKMTTVGGDKWTVMPDEDGIFHTFVRDVDTIHGTVYFDDARVKFNGRSDLAEQPNRVFASGVTPDGMVVKFGAYPGLIQGAAAPYPMDDNSAFGIGTTDGDTDTGDGISIMGIRLRVTGYLDPRPFYSTYDADMANGIKDLQRDADLAVTGTMNLNTWRALWDLSVTGYDLNGIEILPAAEDTVVKPFRRSSTGAIIARNPNYDATVNPVDRTVAMGQGTKAQIRQNARNLLAGGEVWRGTIEISTGAIIAGEHAPGDPIAELLRARAIEPGMNLWAPLFAGGIVLHVSGVSVTESGVSLVVSTIPDDTIPTWAAIQRDRDNRNTVHRSFFAQRRSSSFERENTYDEVGGTISPVTLRPDNWTVFPVVAKQAGTIEKIHMQLSPAREFVVAVFGRKVSPGRLRRVTNAPLTKAGREKWTEEAVYDALNRDHVVLYVAGSDEDPCGYFPKRKSDEGSPALTGRWEDDASFDFVTFMNDSDRGSVLWVAVWVGASATLRGGRIMWPSAEDY